MTEPIMDYGQMFEMLSLDFLPGEEDDLDPHGKAVVEYFDYLERISCLRDDAPEVVFGCNVLRTFLREFGKGFNDYKKPVLKALAEVEYDYHMLRLVNPLLTYMWI